MSKSKRDKKKPDTKRKEDTEKPGTQAEVKAKKRKLYRVTYELELARLQVELVKMKEWIAAKKLKVATIFGGREAAAKGGAIKRINEKLSPRMCKVVALSAPTERERSQWYFQRYVQHLSTAGEMVLLE